MSVKTLIEEAQDNIGNLEGNTHIMNLTALRLRQALDEDEAKEKRIQKLEAQLTNEKRTCAKAYTAYQNRIHKLEGGYRQIKILNAGKDNDIEWLCEQALKVTDENTQGNTI